MRASPFAVQFGCISSAEARWNGSTDDFPMASSIPYAETAGASLAEDGGKSKLALFSRNEHHLTSSARVRAICLRFCEAEVGNRDRPSNRANRNRFENVRTTKSKQQSSIHSREVADFDSANLREICLARMGLVVLRRPMRLARNF